MGMGCASEAPGPFAAAPPAPENEICGVSVVLLSPILPMGSLTLVFDQPGPIEFTNSHLTHNHCNFMFIVFGCLLIIFLSFTCPARTGCLY